MKKLILLLLCAAGAGQLAAQSTVSDSFMHNGVWRNYIVYIPAGYTAANPPPLVLNFHGLGSNAASQMAYSNFMPIADTAGFILVCPNGTTESGLTYWNVGFGGTADDVGFVDTLITKLTAQYTINPERVYATGMSNGGYMSYILASELSNRIAAIASVAGTMTPGKFAAASPGRAIPVMQVHGTADATVPYAGFDNGVHIDSLMKFWVVNAGCNPTPAVTQLPDVNTSDNSTATHYVWSGGSAGATVELYKVANGEHTWPGSPFVIGVTNQDFSASKEIWRFFNQYSLSGALAVGTVQEKAAQQMLYPNPGAGFVQVPGCAAGAVVTVQDVAGRLVLTAAVANGGIDISTLQPGSYLVQYVADGRKLASRLIKK